MHLCSFAHKFPTEVNFVIVTSNYNFDLKPLCNGFDALGHSPICPKTFNSWLIFWDVALMFPHNNLFSWLHDSAGRKLKSDYTLRPSSFSPSNIAMVTMTKHVSFRFVRPHYKSSKWNVLLGVHLHTVICFDVVFRVVTSSSLDRHPVHVGKSLVSLLIKTLT